MMTPVTAAKSGLVTGILGSPRIGTSWTNVKRAPQLLSSGERNEREIDLLGIERKICDLPRQ
jgi:hypothetical protein